MHGKFSPVEYTLRQLYAHPSARRPSSPRNFDILTGTERGLDAVADAPHYLSYWKLQTSVGISVIADVFHLTEGA
jgi:hypothetical protein